MAYTVTLTDECTISRQFPTLADALEYTSDATCNHVNALQLVSDMLQLGEHICEVAGVWVHVVASRMH